MVIILTILDVFFGRKNVCLGVNGNLGVGPTCWSLVEGAWEERMGGNRV